MRWRIRPRKNPIEAYSSQYPRPTRLSLAPLSHVFLRPLSKPHNSATTSGRSVRLLTPARFNTPAHDPREARHAPSFNLSQTRRSPLLTLPVTVTRPQPPDPPPACRVSAKKPGLLLRAQPAPGRPEPHTPREAKRHFPRNLPRRLYRGRGLAARADRRATGGMRTQRRRRLGRTGRAARGRFGRNPRLRPTATGTPRLGR